MKEPPKFGSHFTCLTCATTETENLEPREFLIHIMQRHGVTKQNARGPKDLEMHIDMANYYISQYRWRIGPVEACQIEIGPRGASLRKPR